MEGQQDDQVFQNCSKQKSFKFIKDFQSDAFLRNIKLSWATFFH